MGTQARRRKHLNEEQKEIMICFMELNGDISAPVFNNSGEGREKKLKLMQDLAELLNSCENGVTRTPKDWLKCWMDNKNKTKCKANAISKQNAGLRKSAQHIITPLTAWEERIISLMQVEWILGQEVEEVTADSITKPEKKQTSKLQNESIKLNQSEAGPSYQTPETEIKKRKHLNEEQKEVMISFMEEHGDIASSDFKTLHTRDVKVRLTQRLTQLLNSCKNGVNRTPTEWMSSWSHNKNKARLKAASVIANDSSLKLSPLNQWDQRVLKLKAKENKTTDNNPKTSTENDSSKIKENQMIEISQKTSPGNDLGKLKENKTINILRKTCPVNDSTKLKENTIDILQTTSPEDDSGNENTTTQNEKQGQPKINEQAYIYVGSKEGYVLYQPLGNQNIILSTSKPSPTEAGPSSTYSHFEQNDHDYAVINESSSTGSTTPKGPQRGTKRVRLSSQEVDDDDDDDDDDGEGDDFKSFIQKYVKVQEQTNAAIIQLAASFREGCKEIAESCNNIAAAFSKKN